jgi:hypothetical protein
MSGNLYNQGYIQVLWLFNVVINYVISNW